MPDFDWNAEPNRPLSVEDVWELMCNGCNTHEIEVAAGVSRATAVGLMGRAARQYETKGELRRAA